MCLFFGKKRKKDKKKTVVNEPVNKNLRFASPDEFNVFQADNMVKFARSDDSNIIGFGASRESDRGNNMLVVDNRDNAENFIAPMIKSTDLSFIVFDQDGEIKDAVSDNLKDRGYDIRTLSFSDSGSNDRFDIFEAVNITKMSGKLPEIISQHFVDACDRKISEMLFGAVIEYLLASKITVSCDSVKSVFEKIVSGDKETFAYMQRCPASAKMLQKAIPGLTGEDLYRVTNDILAQIIPVMAKLCDKPSAFSIFLPKRKAAFFVTSADKELKYIATAFIYNAVILSNFEKGKELTTVFVDESHADWYNVSFINNVRTEIKAALGDCISKITVKPTIDSNYLLKNSAETDFVLYVCSEDASTMKWVEDHCRYKCFSTDQEVSDLVKTYGASVVDKMMEEKLTSRDQFVSDGKWLLFALSGDDRLRAKVLKCAAL